MPRPVLMFALLFALAYAGFLGYSFAGRNASAGQDAERLLTQSTAAMQPPVLATETQSESVAAGVATAETVAVSPGMLAGWIADVTGDDPGKRAAAIVALATAPKAEAVPVLNAVLGAATEEDKQLSLQSLRTLALTQGDDDGRIRDGVRHVIYHDSSEAAVGSAQTILAELESSPAGGASTANR